MTIQRYAYSGDGGKRMIYKSVRTKHLQNRILTTSGNIYALLKMSIHEACKGLLVYREDGQLSILCPFCKINPFFFLSGYCLPGSFRITKLKTSTSSLIRILLPFFFSQLIFNMGSLPNHDPRCHN